VAKPWRSGAGALRSRVFGYPRIQLRGRAAPVPGDQRERSSSRGPPPASPWGDGRGRSLPAGEDGWGINDKTGAKRPTT
jgi:hypothetical protein